MRQLRKRISRALISRRPKLTTNWQIAALEPRVMLAGDAGAEVGLSLDLRGETGQERVEIWVGDDSLGPRFLSTDWRRFEFDVDSSNYR